MYLIHMRNDQNYPPKMQNRLLPHTTHIIDFSHASHSIDTSLSKLNIFCTAASGIDEASSIFDIRSVT